MDKERSLNLEGLFKGADLSGAQIIAVNEGEVYYTKYGAGAASRTKTEEEVRQAVEQLMNAKDEQGGFLMHDSDQWYAVFRVLSTFCGFPTKAPEFARAMKNMGMDDMRLPCVYENFRKVSPSQLPANVGLWSQYKNTTDQYSMKQVVVAMKLMEILEI